MNIFDNAQVFNTCVVSCFPQPREHNAHCSLLKCYGSSWLILFLTEWTSTEDSHTTQVIWSAICTATHTSNSGGQLCQSSPWSAKQSINTPLPIFLRGGGRYCDTISKMDITQASKLGLVIRALALITKQNLWLMVLPDIVMCTWINY